MKRVMTKGTLKRGNKKGQPGMILMVISSIGKPHDAQWHTPRSAKQEAFIP